MSTTYVGQGPYEMVAGVAGCEPMVLHVDPLLSHNSARSGKVSDNHSYQGITPLEVARLPLSPLVSGLPKPIAPSFGSCHAHLWFVIPAPGAEHVSQNVET